ncbi:hypothetical protein G5V59_10665 [Nocardioides sp. W3-2-3]|uniref:peptidoglycan binding domain-containing protein n=1 Tax=Nocardioides convexus TaxID=2712224 RepID=UPI00241845BB|nr:peptidoglycan binding domain-containing protein [Nocardioides convexus]NHA00394.1 hypothetical protein [Nocardioides convexus]
MRPSAIGMSIDYAASVDAAGAGSSWSPKRQWDYFAGGEDTAAVVRVDQARFDDRLAALSKGLGTPPKDGQVRFSADGVDTVPPVAGQAIDADAARETLTDAFLSGKDDVTLEVTKAQPDVDAAEVAEAVKTFAEPAMAAPVTLAFGKNNVVLAPARFAAALSMKPENGALVPVVDQAVLTRLVASATSDGKPVDATVRLVKGKPRVVPAKPGVEFDPAQVADVFQGLLTQPAGKRSGTVDAKVKEAAFTTEDATNLKIVEKVSEFSTHYPHADYRNTNIGRAAKPDRRHGAQAGRGVLPQQSLVGERTAENGFTEGYVISNGILKAWTSAAASRRWRRRPSTRCSSPASRTSSTSRTRSTSTATRSAARPRWPGRRSTCASRTTPTTASSSTPGSSRAGSSRQGTVTVQMWSTKVWDIDSKTSARYAYVAPATRTLTTSDCEPHTGSSGFQVDVTRIFRKHGSSAIDHTEKFHTNYTPADTVICKQPAPPPKQKPGDD